MASSKHVKWDEYSSAILPLISSRTPLVGSAETKPMRSFREFLEGWWPTNDFLYCAVIAVKFLVTKIENSSPAAISVIKLFCIL